MKKTTVLNMMTKVVLYCCLFLTVYTVWNGYEAHRLNIPMSDTLTTCVFAFWGTEMCLMMAKKLIDKKLKPNNADQSAAYVQEKPGEEPGREETEYEVDYR